MRMNKDSRGLWDPEKRIIDKNPRSSAFVIRENPRPIIRGPGVGDWIIKTEI